MKNRILMVDDDAFCRQAAKVFISRTDFKLDVLSSGEECIEFIKDNNADLILLDVEMPRMNGYETLSEIRRNERFKDIPVIFMSGTENLLKKALSADCSADGILKKPFTPDTLIKTIQSVLNR